MKRCAVLMVCMGNICRSPTAEGVLRDKLSHAGFRDAVMVDSAGTHTWHEGEPPDPRSVRHARRRGYDIATLRARPVVDADFERFDLILAMDSDNLDELRQRCPAQHFSKLGRLTGHSRRFNSPTVPDPYSGGAADFEHVLDLIEDACDGLIEELALRVERN
jgi:protein-tyrosine phosphatase